MPVESLELLAPAGDAESLQACLEAGTDAVYIGLTSLNARRHARNFYPSEFPDAVKRAHSYNARLYLTLNILLTERELGHAFRIIQLCQETGTDAVLVRDPSLLLLTQYYPDLEYHFSTQASITNSADVCAARDLGISRVVLARELSIEEISAASRISEVRTEVFCQGALCYSISGHCLLASWGGAHSGNRGACTSPCRVAWNQAGEYASLFSMRDLAVPEQISALAAAGVTALKIEGRLKKPDWINSAVTAYRRLIDGTDYESASADIARLGEYTGRSLTDNYLRGITTSMTGIAGRISSAAPDIPAEEKSDTSRLTYQLDLEVTEKEITFVCHAAGRSTSWRLPRTIPRRKSLSLEEYLQNLSEQTIHDRVLTHYTVNQPSFRIPPRNANMIDKHISTFLQRLKKPLSHRVRLELPDDVKELLTPSPRCDENKIRLGRPPTRLRLSPTQTPLSRNWVVEAPTSKQLSAILDRPFPPQVVALPSVFFEKDIPEIENVILIAQKNNLIVEVNSWGGWYLAKDRVIMESGPGMPVLNSLAALALHQRDITAVTISPEADRQRIEEMLEHCSVPCMLMIYGRPPLLTTRVSSVPAGLRFTDRRNITIKSSREGAVTVFRPVVPFDWSRIINPEICVRELTVDLVGSENYEEEWKNILERRSSGTDFNYHRSLY